MWSSLVDARASEGETGVVRHLLLLLLAGACTASSGGEPLGGSCSHAVPCATGGVCDYTAVDGPICIDAEADTDGDGLINAIDHCPNVPGGLYDEDNDGIGDDCDKCPIAPPPAVPDPDGDDVDSPCDPDPNTPGDHILFFDGFQGSALGSAWIAAGDPTLWTPEGGELVVDSDVPAEQYLTINVAPQPNFAVETSYRVDELETSATTHTVATRALDSRPAGTAVFECGAVDSDVAISEVVALQTDVNSTSHPAEIPAFASASLYESAAYASGPSVGCTVIGDNMAVGTTQSAITPSSLGQVSLGVRAVTARFEWVLVVGHANAP